VEGEALITYRSLRGTRFISTRLPANAVVKRQYRLLSKMRGKSCIHVRDSARTTADLIKELSQDPSVERVTPNFIRRVSADFPSDALFTNQWGLHNTGQVVAGSPGTPDADVDLPESRTLLAGLNPEIVIAIIDTGVDYEHPDLIGNMWHNQNENPTNGLDDDGNGYIDDYFGYDFAGDPPDNTPDSDPMDLDGVSGHGTHVAGTAAASTDNGRGVAGVSGLAGIMALKASYDGEHLLLSDTMAAIEYATMMKTGGVNIVAINASYGVADTFSQDEKDAIQAANQAGIVFCAAAGNDSADTDVTPNYPSGYDLDGIVSVAATDNSDNLASISNYGTNSVDLGAPGENILSSIPRHIGAQSSVTGTGFSYSADPIAFGGITTGVTATVYDCGLGYPSNFPPAVAGNIALIERGTLTFAVKTENAMDAGALAAIIYDNTTGLRLWTLQWPSNWIPAVSLARVDGLALLGLGEVEATVTNAPTETSVYDYLTGTSMACPHVAGAMALMAHHFPQDSVTQRIARIMDNTAPVAALNGKVRTGGRLNLVEPVDSDWDQLPDWWELTYYPSLLIMDSSSNSDEDEHIDREEYLAGTNPDDGADFLRMKSVASGTGSVLVVQWSSVSNRAYSIMQATNLTSGFSAIASNLVASPPLNASTVSVDTASRAFFNVRVR